MITERGLTKYNGHTAKYYSATQDSSGLLPVTLFNIFIEKSGKIWISYMDACVSLFDPVSEKFTHYYHDPKNPKSFPYGAVSQFLRTSKNELWMAVWGGGLCKLDEKKNEFIRFTPVKGDTTIVNTTEITCLAEMSDGKLMVGTWESGGWGAQAFLHVFDPSSGKAKRFPVYEYDLGSDNLAGGVRAAFKIVHFIHIDEKNDYWIGSFLGLYHINNKTKTIRRYSDLMKRNSQDNINGGIENAVFGLQVGRKFWVGTEVTGIMVADMDNGHTQTLRHNYEKVQTISGDNILGLFKDDDENVWVSTRAGVDVYTPLLQQFKFLSNQKLLAEKENKSQGTSSINHVLVAKNGNIYFSHGNGVTVYDPRNDSVHRIDVGKIYQTESRKGKLPKLFNSNVIRDAFETDHYFFFLQVGMLLTIRKNDSKVAYLDPGFNYLSVCENKKENEVWFIVANQKKEKNIQRGYYLLKYDASDLTLKRQIKMPDFMYSDLAWIEGGIFQSIDGENWIFNINRGLFGVFNSTQEKFDFYGGRKGLSFFPDSMLSLMYIDRSKNVWIRATAGIYKFNFVTKKSILYNDTLEINRENVSSVLMDEKNDLWFALTSDLIHYNPRTREKFRYSSDLGVNSGGFSTIRNNNLYSKRLYFVGPYGVTHFDPEQLYFNKKRPHVFLANLILNGDTLSEAEKVEYLIKRKKIEWNKNFLTFEFSTYQHYNPGIKSYTYRLLGLDSVWYKNGSRNYVSYTNLSHGSYTFEVKYRNSYGVNSDVFSIPFTIDKPVWLKWWFIVLEVIIAASLIYLYIRKRERKLNNEKIKLELKVEERTKELVEKANQIELQSVIITEKNKELTDSIKYARRIQGTLLAKLEFMKANLPEHFVLFKPKDIVSGDFYWATKVEAGMSEFVPGQKRNSSDQDDLFYFAVCDSTGHGVPGAFMSLLNISYLNEAIGEMRMRTPHSILNFVRQKLIDNLSVDGAQDGMDGTLICYNKSKGIITYASAHNHPVLIRNGMLSELPSDKMPIGKGERLDSFHLHEVELKKGDFMYFYTDGFADQFGGPKGKKFKYRQLNELLLRISSIRMEEQHAILNTDFDNWKGKLEQVDDVLVIGIRFD